MSTLETKLTSTSEELRKTEIKLSAITEYFQQKELDLHSKLEAGEQTRRQFESYVSEAVDKEKARENDRDMQRKELENLRAEMKDIEASYLSQAKSHEKRAEECAVSVCGGVSVGRGDRDEGYRGLVSESGQESREASRGVCCECVCRGWSDHLLFR